MGGGPGGPAGGPVRELEAAGAAGTNGRMGRPKTALIVDDEAHVRAYAKLLLREAGIREVWEAADGGQAIAALEAHEPELVLLDVNLPVMSGLEVLRQLQEAGWTTPVVMLTAENATKTVQEAAKFGARHSLQ